MQSKIKRAKKRTIATMLLLLLGIVVISLLLGPVIIAPEKIFGAILSKAFGVPADRFADIVVWQIRLPRICLAALVGALLSTSGVILQGILKNPLADPYILGVSAGGGLGAALALILGIEFTLFGISFIPLFAFIFALIAAGIVYQLARINGRTTTETLILAGVAVSSFCAAILSLIIILSGEMEKIYFWLLGGFSDATWGQVITLLPYIVVGFIITYFYSKELNASLLGEETALTLGVDIEKIRAILIIVASFMTAAAVSFSGLIGFVGLIVPHFVRIFIGYNHRFILPIAALSGAFLLVVADALSRIIFAPMEIPIGIVMALIGAPFFLYVLRKSESANS